VRLVGRALRRVLGVILLLVSWDVMIFDELGRFGVGMVLNFLFLLARFFLISFTITSIN